MFDDLTASQWDSGSRPFHVGDGPDAITIDHNTNITTDSVILWLYGGPATAPTAITTAVYTNNMSAHNSYGIDQIVLSAEKYLKTAPGALKNDTTIVPR